MDHAQQNVAPLAAYAFPQLSEPQLVLRIFSLLPVDQRLRCAEVSRAWRATVALPELWRRVDLSVNSNVQYLTPALLHAVVARAGGALTALDMTDADFGTVALAAALRAASQLVEVCLGDPDLAPPDSLQQVTDILTAAPQLRELHTVVTCGSTHCVHLLERRPPYGPVRLAGLGIMGHYSALPPALILALPDASLQPSLSRLSLNHAFLHLPGALDAIADAVVARGALTHLCFHSCLFPPSPAPALAHALRDGALTELKISADDVQQHQPFPFDLAGAALLGDALRASRALDSLALWHMPARVVAALIHTLVGHGSLSKLGLSCSHLADAAVGAALTVLLAADAPALLELKLRESLLGEAGMGLLCDALPRNSHLCSLDLGENTESMPAGFIRNRLLPAVRANTGLRHLEVHDPADDDDAAAWAEALFSPDGAWRWLILTARGRTPRSLQAAGAKALAAGRDAMRAALQERRRWGGQRICRQARASDRALSTLA